MNMSTARGILLGMTSSSTTFAYVDGISRKDESTRCLGLSGTADSVESTVLMDFPVNLGPALKSRRKATAVTTDADSKALPCRNARL